MNKTLKSVSLFLFILGFGVLTLKAELAVIYQNEEAVSKGESSWGVATKEGVLIQADEVMKAQGKPIIGLLPEGLYRGSLLRLDNELNAALVKIGDPVKDEKLIDAHEKQAADWADFLSQGGIPVEVGGGRPPAESHVEERFTKEPFLIKVNGEPLLDKPVVLKPNKRKEAYVTLEVLRSQKGRFWWVNAQIESDPPMLFWRKGKTKTMNDVPRRKFTYDYQAMFRPIKKGRSFKIPLELSSIKKDSYVWTLTLKIKKDTWQTQIPVQIER